MKELGFQFNRSKNGGFFINRWRQLVLMPIARPGRRRLFSRYEMQRGLRGWRDNVRQEFMQYPLYDAF
jgi:hypothetical protein